jgi:hypothetical protein
MIGKFSVGSMYRALTQLDVLVDNNIKGKTKIPIKKKSLHCIFVEV